MSQYVNEVLKFPRLSDDEALELIALKMMGHEIARDILITHYLQCAFYIACKYQDRIKLPIDDMIGIGSEAVINAIDNYKSNSNATVQTVVYKYLRVKYSKYIEYYFSAKRDYRCEVSFHNEEFKEGPEFSYRLSNGEGSLEENYVDEELRMLALDLLKILPDRNRETICWRYGFADGKFHTLEETGAILGITGEGVRLRESVALKKLELAAKKQGLII